MTEKIICAAIHFDDEKEHVHQPKNILRGFVIGGRRHHNCYGTIFAIKEGLKMLKHTQGFLTNMDRFVDRREAFVIAKREGQLLVDYTDDGENILFSEDLY